MNTNKTNSKDFNQNLNTEQTNIHVNYKNK